MQTCLSCHAEYNQNEGEATVLRCPDCGSRTLDDAELAGWKRLRDDLGHEDFLPVRIFDGPVDRALISAIFDDEGVPYVVHGGGMFSDALSAQNGYGVLLVAEDSEAKARRLLLQYDEAVVDLPSDEA
jgi:hypothetical protein